VRRTASDPDVSVDADPASGVLAYDSTPYQGSSGWYFARRLEPDPCRRRRPSSTTYASRCRVSWRPHATTSGCSDERHGLSPEHGGAPRGLLHLHSSPRPSTFGCQRLRGNSTHNSRRRRRQIAPVPQQAVRSIRYGAAREKSRGGIGKSRHHARRGFTLSTAPVNALAADQTL
jgi:hypothetical protein